MKDKERAQIRTKDSSKQNSSSFSCSCRNHRYQCHELWITLFFLRILDFLFPTASGDNACCDLQSDALKLKGVIRTLWTVIGFIYCFRYWRASREEQPKRIMGEAEDGSLVL